MTSPIYSGLAVLAGGVLLSHCGGTGLPADIRHTCLAESAGGAVVPLNGYPVSLIEDGERKRGGSVSLHDGVLVLTDHDRLTGRTNVMRFQVEPGASAYRSDQCGPKTLVVTRLASDGQIVEGLEMQDLLVAMVKTYAAETGARDPVEADQHPISTASLQAAPARMEPSASGLAPAQPAPPAGPSMVPQPGAPENSVTGAAGGYSAAYRTCMASGEAASGVTVAVMSCTGDELARQDATLNQLYRAAMARLPTGAGASLKAQERAWIKSRDAQCHQQMEDAGGGTLSEVVYSKCELDQTITRVATLSRLAP